ncbi:MAG: integration host factor subunit beta [Candidatus Latescibacterota bacterium]|nr:MAG: integration host factor subunit beta [Candidatus Latescibacterota bacterium]
MTKADLVDEVVHATGLPKKDVALIVDGFLEAICQTLINNGHVEIRGFGSFKIKYAKARVARNPRSGATVQVPSKLVPFFKVSRELKALVDGEEEEGGPKTAFGSETAGVSGDSADSY